MASFSVETFVLPIHWASYFVNADPSGLDDDDIVAADGWWQATFSGQCVSCTDVADDSGFCRFHDAEHWCLACDVATFTFLIHQEG
jgi:hypothetical protein